MRRPAAVEPSITTMGAEYEEMDAMIGQIRGRAWGRMLMAVGLALAVMLSCGQAAMAAPTFSVQLTRDQSSITRGDQYLSYKVRVTNVAGANPVVGATLTCAANSWAPASGALTPSLRYQWLRNGVPIVGAVNPTYVLSASSATTPVTTAGDAGAAIQCQVFGANSSATTTAVSAPIVTAPAPGTIPPRPTSPTAASSRPVVTGTGAVVGTSTRTCAVPADWSGSPSYAFQWLRNGVAIDPSESADVTTATHTILAGDVNKILQCRVIGTNAGGAAAGISLNNVVGTVTSPPANAVGATPSLSSSDFAAGTITAAFSFSPGVKLATGSGFGGNSWICQAPAAACTSTTSLAPGATSLELAVVAWVDPDVAPDEIVATVAVYGGGAPGNAIAQDAITQGAAPPFGITSLLVGAFDQLGGDDTQAGGHPFRASSSAAWPFHITPEDTLRSNEHVRNVVFDLPPGVIGNPLAATQCTIEEIKVAQCPESAAVGGVDVDLDNTLSRTFTNDLAGEPVPLYRTIAEAGYPASFAFRPVSVATLAYVLRPKLRSNGDYGVTVISPQAPQKHGLVRIKDATLCAHGASTLTGGGRSVFVGCKSSSDPAALDVPFLSSPTECLAQGPVTTLQIDSWQHPAATTPDGFPDPGDDNWKRRSVETPPTTGCDQVPFDPAMSVSATSAARDSASGLDVELDVPQDGLLDPEGIATAHLKKTVVELPEGFSVNPSAATGLEGCSDEQIELDRLTAPKCPDASKLGTVTVTTPVVDEPLEGVMFLATPKSTDPTSGEMLRLWLSVRNDKLGLSAKLPGSTVADPQTGRLTATFDNNPRVPFDHLEVHLRGGDKGVLATPQSCGAKTTQTTLTPWSGTGPVDRPSDTSVDGDCGEKFAPKLSAGSSDNGARGKGGTYSFKFSREDGEQWFKGLTAALPQGLLASVKDVPLCSNAAADAGACPADSKIGIVDAKAGAGNPFVLEQKGEVFLTKGYKGGEYGLAVKIRPVAGPFRGDMELSPIIVRQAIHVDRTTAQVTAISDPFPLIHHGIPLRAREVNVLVNRGGFMLNPSDCSAKQSGAELLSAEGATSNLTDPFQVSGCADLPFKPKLALALTGKRQVTTGKHPGIKATVTQAGTSEAGIEKAVVRLPKSLALDPNNAQALCEFEDGTKPDLENHCPAGSIVGRARAKTPLLEDDLVGNVYFVKNVRTDPTTGNLIRTLPMIIVALRGEIAINLRGESDTTNSGKLVNTFANVPDAPISQFNLNIQGGKTGIIAVTRTRKAKINVCTGRHIAETDMDGHNGRRHDVDVRMKTPCTKKQTKAAKRAAAKARRG